jgi:hypothetical protein
MKNKIQFIKILSVIALVAIGITGFLYFTAQTPINPGLPGQVWTSNGGGPAPTFQNPGLSLLDTVTVNLNITTGQGLKLAGLTGSRFVINDIIITNATATPTSAKGGRWYTKNSTSTGTLIAETKLQTTSVFTFLTSDSAYLDKGNSGYIVMWPGGHPYLLTNDSMYFFCDTANGSACQVREYIYGHKIL